MPICIRGALTLMLIHTSVAAGCSDGDPLVLGRKPSPDAGSQAHAGTSAGNFGNAGTSAPSGLDASSPRPSSLRVQIEREAVAVEIVTVQCAGECVDVEAVARGGFPPYAYAWEDGSTDPTRRLCPRATTPFTVAATDSGLDSPEFQLKPSTAKSTVTAEVLACADAGARPDGGSLAPDAGEPGSQCTNPPSASASCIPLPLEPCGESQLVAVLPAPIEAAGSACFVLMVAGPPGSLPMDWASIDLSTGPDACASDDMIGVFSTPLVVDSRWTDNLCVGIGQRITRVGMTRLTTFLGESFEQYLHVCDVCPL